MLQKRLIEGKRKYGGSDGPFVIVNALWWLGEGGCRGEQGAVFWWFARCCSPYPSVSGKSAVEMRRAPVLLSASQLVPVSNERVDCW